MKKLTVEEAALAWAQGKRVEARHADSNKWLPVDPVGQCLQEHYSPSVFTDPECRFRLAPEPPSKKWRPWKPEEVPVGALIRHKRVPGVGLILGNGASYKLGSAFVDRYQIRIEPCGMALDNYEHSLDNGKTWLPCGVEVDA